LTVVLMDHCCKIIEVSNRIGFCVSLMSLEKYGDNTMKMAAWNKFAVIN
jgi:hypothetical protein